MRTVILSLLLLGACKTKAVIDDTSPPPLGTRMFDRVGRPAVNSALIGVVKPRGEKNLLQEQYNTTDTEGWPAFASEIAANLAIYDALDAVCGNQLLAGADAAPGRYAALAGVLADDRLFIDTRAGTCAQYLAVELGVSGDCGGRTPAYDVIDTTYSALAVGAPTGVPDGVDADRAALPPDFPFFAR